jgi:ribosomal protein S27AE
MEAIVILIFFGLSAGTVAKIKGSSFLIWFMVGFVLPGIGTIAALLYRNERTGLHRRCPECGNVVALHDQVCMQCGRDLEFPDPVAEEHTV